MFLILIQICKTTKLCNNLKNRRYCNLKIREFKIYLELSLTTKLICHHITNKKPYINLLKFITNYYEKF